MSTVAQHRDVRARAEKNGCGAEGDATPPEAVAAQLQAEEEGAVGAPGEEEEEKPSIPTLSPQQREALVQIGMLRHLYSSSGKRTLPAFGLWSQVAMMTDSLFVVAERLLPLARSTIERLAAATGIPSSGFTLERLAKGGLRDPVQVWMNVGLAADSEFGQDGPSSWRARLVFKGETGDVCLALLRKLTHGFSWESPDGMVNLKLLRMDNYFSSRTLHPSHYRKAECYIAIVCGRSRVVFQLHVEHAQLRADY